jgi:hypothetical protein
MATIFCKLRDASSGHRARFLLGTAQMSQSITLDGLDQLASNLKPRRYETSSRPVPG